MAQIINITSEALQATIRRLLPSQQGFGEDLQASNVVQPIIDLTPTAEGSQLPVDLARAINFADATEFETLNESETIANTPGFYRIIGCAALGNANSNAGFSMTDGSGTFKEVWDLKITHSTTTVGATASYDFNVFLDQGDSILAFSGSEATVSGSIRQIADRYGNISNPSGFTFE